MTLSEKASKGSAFAGWTQVCPHTAKTCDITVGYPSANPFAWNSTPIGVQFASTRARIIGFTKNKVNLKLPSAGRVILKAPGTLKVTKYFKRFDHNDIAIKLKRSLRAKIAKNGSARVKFTLTFFPMGAIVSGRAVKSLTVTK
jgi:hypothetical protein